MEFFWFGVAGILFLVWAGISLSQKLSGDKHQREAREATEAGDWETAATGYKMAILSRLDAREKLSELVAELDAVYRAQALECDLSRLLECPELLKTLGAGTGSQRKKNELIMKLYTETGEFLDTLPGPPLPTD